MWDELSQKTGHEDDFDQKISDKIEESSIGLLNSEKNNLSSLPNIEEKEEKEEDDKEETNVGNGEETQNSLGQTD